MRSVLKLLQPRKRQLQNDKWHTLMVNSPTAGIQRHCAQTQQLHNGSAQTPATLQELPGHDDSELTRTDLSIYRACSAGVNVRLWTLVRNQETSPEQSTKQLPRTTRLDRFRLSAE